MKKRFFLIFALIASVATAKVKNNQKFDTWTVDCGNEQCGIYQENKTKDGVPVARVFIHKPKETMGIAIAFITVPLGIDLLAQLGISVDNKSITKIAFHRCDTQGCHAVLPLEGQILPKMKAGRNMQIEVFVNDKKQSLKFSLKGITKAIESL